jgi:hypothetical protein
LDITINNNNGGFVNILNDVSSNFFRIRTEDSLGTTYSQVVTNQFSVRMTAQSPTQIQELDIKPTGVSIYDQNSVGRMLFDISNISSFEVRSLIMRDGNVDLTGGSDGDVLAVQSDGSLAIESIVNQDLDSVLETGSIADISQDLDIVINNTGGGQTRIFNDVSPSPVFSIKIEDSVGNDYSEISMSDTSFIASYFETTNNKGYGIGMSSFNGVAFERWDLGSNIAFNMDDFGFFANYFMYLRAANIDFRGGSDGDVLMVQSDGSLAIESLPPLGVDTFLELTDVDEADYTGHDRDLVFVDETGGHLNFIPFSDLLDDESVFTLSDVNNPNSYLPKTVLVGTGTDYRPRQLQIDDLSDADDVVKTVAGIAPVAGEVSPTLDDIPDGISRSLLTEAEAEQAGVQSGTSFPISPNDYQSFFRTDLGLMFVYDASRSKWLSRDVTRQLVYANNQTNLTGTNLLIQAYGASNTSVFEGEWTIVGYSAGNGQSNFEGNFRLVESVGGSSDILDVAFVSADGGAKNDFTLNIDLDDPEICVMRLDVTASDCDRPEWIIYLKRRAT